MQNEYAILTESPRDAMQGIKKFIATENKIKYINAVIDSGFDYTDFGSFVSPHVVPQMKDTETVIKSLQNKGKKSKLMVLAGSIKTCIKACEQLIIDSISFPFSVSEVFLKNNLNISISDAFKRSVEMKNICNSYNKDFIVYITMGLGNPYQETWNPEITIYWAEKLAKEGVKTILVSDIVACSTTKDIERLCKGFEKNLPEIDFGLHLHTRNEDWQEKIEASIDNGCLRFDSVINGVGGCPFALGGKLTGNLDTIKLIEFLRTKSIESKVDLNKLKKAIDISTEIFSSYK